MATSVANAPLSAPPPSRHRTGSAGGLQVVVVAHEAETRHEPYVCHGAQSDRLGGIDLDRPFRCAQEEGHHTVVAGNGVLHSAFVAIDPHLDPPALGVLMHKVGIGYDRKQKTGTMVISVNAVRFPFPTPEWITMKRIHHRSTTLAALGLVVLLVGAGCRDRVTNPNTTSADPPGRVDLPYNPDPPKGARMIATLTGDPAMDGGCVWLRQGTTDFGVLWPGGFAAEFNPVRLYDAEGELVAQEGDQVELTASFTADPAAYQPHRCAVGSVLWLAGQVGKGE